MCASTWFSFLLFNQGYSMCYHPPNFRLNFPSNDAERGSAEMIACRQAMAIDSLSKALQSLRGR